MSNICKKLLALFCCITAALLLTSCEIFEEEEEDFLSTTQDVTEKLMVGSWKLTAASTDGPGYVNENDNVERLTNDLPTTMTSVDIVKGAATFHFSSPVTYTIRTVGEDHLFHDLTSKVTSITAKINERCKIDGLKAEVDYLDNYTKKTIEFIQYPESWYDGDISLYGKSEKKADRIIIALTGNGNGAWFEFVHK